MFILYIQLILTAFANAQSSLTLNAPIGSLAFASIHEAGHVVAATSLSFFVIEARVFQQNRGASVRYWKGLTTLRPKSGARGMAVVKLAGNFAEFFIDHNDRVRAPSFLEVIGNRNVISRSDVITRQDLGA